MKVAFAAYSDESGHPLRFISYSHRVRADNCRSEATFPEVERVTYAVCWQAQGSDGDGLRIPQLAWPAVAPCDGLPRPVPTGASHHVRRARSEGVLRCALLRKAPPSSSQR